MNEPAERLAAEGDTTGGAAFTATFPWGAETADATGCTGALLAEGPAVLVSDVAADIL